MPGALTIDLRPDGPRIEAAPAPPVEALMLGRSPEAAAELLPRIFNLCPMAQATAVRLALDLPLPDTAALQAEVEREHRVRLGILWPKLLDLPPAPLPRLPMPADLDDWIARHPLMARLAALFPGTAVADLPPLAPENIFAPLPVENSPAARHAHPTLRAVADRWGKGPLWRAMGRLADLETPLPVPLRLPDGTAVVPAARGAYGVRARAEGGLVTAFARVTPTDHLCAPGGVLEQSLATLPADAGRLAPLLLAILDPCVPVTLSETANA